ncbi:glycosyl hydrolase family 18 protein [Allonocardiopsis opalescens]|uniref:chitinase n=1 Tax=Allonocardiopsis opalescens TaxID=1144618 RepID=A0A2T0Q9C1_9ACTN|nr:glycosyl hydrolase family 18 protein [Allonocardiopsis opalescens]PRY00401.1 chitinase (glycosyl hydrolase family 18) [Allonocardiopsis opalescens]
MKRSRLRAWAAALAGALALAPLTVLAPPASAAPGDLTVTYSVGDTWTTGWSGQLTITNTSSAPVSAWRIVIQTGSGAGIGSLWNATLSSSGSVHTITPPSWGATVPAGGTYGIGFNGTRTTSTSSTALTSCTVDGLPCDGSGGPQDTQAPSVPTGVTAGTPTSTTVPLSWQASSDNVAVAGYEIVSGGQVVRNVVGTATSGTAGGLQPDTAYTFTVRAYDAAGNRSAASAPVQVRTAAEGGGPGPSEDQRVVGYFTQWGVYDRNYLVNNMVTSGSAERLTHINYAFANISPQGTCFQVNQAGQGDAWADYGRSYTAAQSVDGVGDTWDQALRGNFNQLRELKERYPHLRVNLSIGGWTWSRYLSDAALTPQSRERMVSSCIDMFLRGNLPVIDGAGGPGSAAGVFDGIDLDWEWPASAGADGNIIRPEDRENYTALVAEFRRQLDALSAETGEDYELTAFVPADPEKVELGFEVPELMENFDFITVQGYDYHGGWESRTYHQSNLVLDPDDPGPSLFSGEIAVDAYVDRGADPADLVLGVPFYSRGWTGVPAGPDGDGLFQTATGPAPGRYEPGINDWDVIAAQAGGFTLHRDNTLGTAWLYNGSTFWTYDDAVSMRQKTDWAQRQGMGGVMIWSLDGDDAGGTLIRAIDDALAD